MARPLLWQLVPFCAIVQNDCHGAAPDDVEHTISNTANESVVQKLNQCLVRSLEKFTISITILLIEYGSNELMNGCRTGLP